MRTTHARRNSLVWRKRGRGASADMASGEERTLDCVSRGPYRVNMGRLETLPWGPSALSQEFVGIQIVLAKHKLLVSGEDEDMVLLKLDDGGEVPAKRSMLVNFSPVFEAMFKGGFKESTQTVVTLSDMSTPCLKLLLQLAASQPISSLPEMDLLLSLELIQALDQFLVPGGWSLARRITTLLLDPYSAGSIYRQCVGHIVAPLVALKQAALHYALVATMTTNQRRILFDELRACPGALGEVRELLRGQLLPCKYVHIMTATAGSAAQSSTGTSNASISDIDI
uniref:BTB domain-containing protein n=1 Tax=Timema genevievae TaxID=629358 RepID=A0A7R9PKB4_TIMGE|nr:unnamed protein product [Timema genevievae]